MAKRDPHCLSVDSELPQMIAKHNERLRRWEPLRCLSLAFPQVRSLSLVRCFPVADARVLLDSPGAAVVDDRESAEAFGVESESGGGHQIFGDWRMKATSDD